INAMGNPFGEALDLTDVANWPGGNKVASKGRAFVWDTALNTWIFGAAAASIEPWQGFAVRAKQNASGATLTIPATATVPLTANPSAKAPEADDRRVLAFTLEGSDARTQRRLEDRLLEVVFEEGGAIGWDEYDAEKLSPLSESYLLLGVEAARDGRGVLKAAESLPVEPGSVTLPLALETAGAAPSLTLRWPTLETLPAGWAVTLHDLATGESVDLRSQEAYTFRSTVSPRKVFTAAPALKDADASGAATRFVLTIETGEAPVAYAETFEFGMADIAPNPTRGEARVSFTLAEAAETTVAVYDVQGREVVRLLEGRREAGRHAVTWATQSVAPGVYVVRLASGDRVETRRAVVIR
ncbi:MAG: T9SS type A sorting domain-containing protein, partial [Bacteroidota bacterium]